MTQAEIILNRFKANGISQMRIAQALHCRQSTIAGWKSRGFIPAQQQQRVLNIARELNIPLTPADFFDLPVGGSASSGATRPNAPPALGPAA